MIAISTINTSCTRCAFVFSASVGSIASSGPKPQSHDNVILAPSSQTAFANPNFHSSRMQTPAITVAVKSPVPAATTHWLVKSEPDAYAWSDLVRDKRTVWSGVRNFAARNHLKAMHRGDPVLFYESVSTKAVVGIAKVTRTAFPDPTADEPGWVAVELAAVDALPHPVALDRIKSERALAQMALVRIGRLSVQPVAPVEFARILEIGRGE